MPQSLRKIALVGLMGVSYLFPLSVLAVPAIQSQTLIEKVSTFTAYMGLVTLWWAYLTGARRFVGRFIEDLDFVKPIHKYSQIIGPVIIFLHPLAILLSGFWQSIVPGIPGETSMGQRTLIIFGQLSFVMLAVVWFTSAAYRDRFSYRVWSKIHLVSYSVFVLTMVHIWSGEILQNDLLTKFWVIPLMLGHIALLGWQFMTNLSYGVWQYEVRDKIKRGRTSVSIRIDPINAGISPRPGQYVFVQITRFGESHPFVVSQFDEETKMLELTVKALGPWSSKFQDIPEKSKVFVDGPYGTFAQDVIEDPRPLVMIAGGIGVAPFISLISNIPINEKLQSRSSYLIYGNRTFDDVAFKDDLKYIQDNFPQFHVTHVLSDQPNFTGEKGFITGELINKYVFDDLEECNFLICGPAAMLLKVSVDLKNLGINPANISMLNYLD